MDVILWRHAQAHLLPEGSYDRALDMQRKLTAKGERQAARMGQWLNQRLAHSTKILASPAVRCEQTVQALERAYKLHDDVAPDATVDQLLRLVRWPHHNESVLVVGHQPTLGLAVARMLTGQDRPWSIKKGALWWLRCRESEGQLHVIVHAVHSPDCL